MRKILDPIRSIVFTICFYGFSLLYLPLIVLPMALIGGDKLGRKGVCSYCSCALWMARWIMGIRFELRGTEQIPQEGPLLLVAAHQSNVDPMLTVLLRHDLTALAKKELFATPVIGTIIRILNIVRVDRQSGQAHREMEQVGENVRAQGRPLLIYPQGTRAKPGTRRKLKSGAYYMAKNTGLPIYTVATNTGLFWRKGIFHRSGHAIFEVGGPLPFEQDKEKFMAAVHQRIILDSERLCREVGFGHLMPPEEASSIEDAGE